MAQTPTDSSRRKFLQLCSGAGMAMALRGVPVFASSQAVIRKPIPSSGETLPVIGMGSWMTFDVHDDSIARAERVKVLQAFFDHGGALIDSSPMYGSSEETIGYCLQRIDNKERLFAATKVWTWFQQAGIRQMQHSQELWGVQRFDLMQIHNLLDWETHLETLKEWKEQGKIRYLGVTTSHGRRHDELIQIMKKEPLDFVQFTYNILDREAEQYLLPLAHERGIAVIANRPFRRGGLFSYVDDKPLPPWAGEIGCENWAQFFLKFIVSHAAVSCAIPATSRVDHMLENMGAGYGDLPDARMRKRMVDYVVDL